MSEPYQPYEWISHPAHYADRYNWGFECIDLIEKTTFNVGSAIKYLWRCGYKPTAEMRQDTEKAIWYIIREINAWKQHKPDWYHRVHFEPIDYQVITESNPIWHLCQYCDAEQMFTDSHPLSSLLKANDLAQNLLLLIDKTKSEA